MSASEIIYKNLKGLFNDEIYPLIRPESSNKTDSYLTYQILNTTPTNSIDGYLGYELAFVQLDIYSFDYDDTEKLTNQTIEILTNNLNPFHYENRKYFYEEDTKLYRQLIECHIWQQN